MKNEKMSVALSSMAASALMTVGKLIVGLATGSLGIISEALHSFLDFIATVMTYMAVRVSDAPADAEHPYGHGKIESIAALAETVLLFITSFWIVYEAGHRLYTGKYEVEATWWSIAVIVVSIAIDISRARALTRVAKKTNSQALEADALHFSSDVLSSAVVLVGLVFVYFGWPIGDPIAAIGVSLFVCHAGWVMGRRTIDTLIDTAPHGVTERVTALIGKVEGIAGVDRVRVRPAGSRLFVEAEVAVGRGFSQGHVATLREKIAAAVFAEMPEAELTLTTHPLALNDETIHQRVMIIAANHNVHVHHVTVHNSGEQLSVTFDLEVEGSLLLIDAHEIATHLEADMRAEFGAGTEVETHIDPLLNRDMRGIDVPPAELEKISTLVEGLVRETGSLSGVHKLRVRKTDMGLIVLLHCRAAPRRTVAEVHEIVDTLERRMRAARPDIWRIVAHAEPEKG